MFSECEIYQSIGIISDSDGPTQIIVTKIGEKQCMNRKFANKRAGGEE